MDGRKVAVADREPASPARRLGAALLDWLAAGFGVIVVGVALTMVERSALPLLLGPALVFTVVNVVGRGPGELVCGTEIIDSSTGGRLPLARAVVRTALHLGCSYAATMLVWFLCVGVTGAVLTATGNDGEDSWGWLLLLVPVALAAPSLAEAAAVWMSRERLAPWDRVAGARVVRR